MKNSILKAMLDYRHNTVQGNYSSGDAKEGIRKALIEANGGDKLDIKKLRGGRNDLFTLVEVLIDATVGEGLKANDFFNAFVEQRNLAEGDIPQFVTETESNLVVSDIARGTQGIRRQRLNAYESFTLNPTPHAIKVYEELSRILAGQADINVLIDKVSAAVQSQMLDDIYAAWASITSSNVGATYYPAAGSYDEDSLIDLVNHVSAANNSATCALVTTLKGARKLSTGIISNSAKDDFYNVGYATKWNGIMTQIVPQRHAVGGTTFIFNDSKIYIIPTTMDKPIKQTISGDSLLTMGDAASNADFSQEFSLISYWSTGIVTGKKFGIYEIA